VSCAARWLYVPAEQEGQWIEVPWKAQIMVAMRQDDPNPIEAQSCPRYSGSETERAAVARTALFAFWVDGGGDVTPPYLIRSSGSPGIDAAAADCIADWSFSPSRTNDSPVEALTGAEISMRPDGHLSIAEYPPRGHFCGPSWYEGAAKGFEGETDLAFTIGANGRTSDLKVTKPSGNAALDDVAVRCASSWIYRQAAAAGSSGPPTLSALPGPSTAIVAWKGGRAYVLEPGNAK
jgi:TonB family protein